MRRATRQDAGRIAIAGAPAAAPAIAPELNSLRPVFLHGVWRSGSTYVWSRFRAAEGTLCYYEPLHDGLARLTRARIGRDTPEAAAANHHPAMEQPYFAEFAPLTGLRGVRGYQRRFAYEGFAPPVEQDDPALEAYVRGLIDHGRRAGRAAVLGFNRTGLRIAWLQRRFEACNVHIDRDPVDVFSSYLSQLQSGNHYYFLKWMQIVGGNSDYPLFARAAGRFDRLGGLRRLFVSPKKHYRPIVESASLEQLYALTVLAWASCALHALAHCDLVIDIAAAGRPGYAEALAADVLAQTGLSVDFADMDAPSPPSPLRLAQARAIEREVMDEVAALAVEGVIDRDRVSARLGALSPRRAELLARAL